MFYIYTYFSCSVVVREDKKLLTVLFPDGRDGRAFTLKVPHLLVELLLLLLLLLFNCISSSCMRFLTQVDFFF